MWAAQNREVPGLLRNCPLEQTGFLRFLWPMRTSFFQHLQMPLRHPRRVCREALVAFSRLHENPPMISDSPPRRSEPKPAIQVLAGSQRFVEADLPHCLSTRCDGYKYAAFPGDDRCRCYL